jgi:integrase
MPKSFGHSTMKSRCLVNGCVFKRKLPSGKVAWGYSIDAGKDEHGKRKQIFKSGFARKLDADIELAKLVTERAEGQIVRPDPRTFAEFSEAWLSEYADASCSPKTAERYREMLAHVCRAIGQQPLSKVTTLQLQRVYNQLLKEGRRVRRKDGTEETSPLSIKTVRNIHGTVHVALETAVDWGLLRVNPASRCKLPTPPKREAIALDFSAARHLLESCSDHWLADFLIVDTGSGARRGELLALSWHDVGPDFRSVTISKSLEQTKVGLRLKGTKANNIRTIALPQDAIDTLKRVKAFQEEKRALFGSDYRTDLDLVFCHPDGNYIRPDTVTKAVRRLAKKAGFSHVSLHTLRHSHGSQLLSAGVPLPVVSKRLGHTDIYTTARVYAHALASDEAAAAVKWEAAMKSADTKVVEMPKKKQA